MHACRGRLSSAIPQISLYVRLSQLSSRTSLRRRFLYHLRDELSDVSSQAPLMDELTLSGPVAPLSPPSSFFSQALAGSCCAPLRRTLRGHLNAPLRSVLRGPCRAPLPFELLVGTAVRLLAELLMSPMARLFSELLVGRCWAPLLRAPRALRGAPLR